MNRYPVETLEFQPVNVTLDGAAVVADVKFSVVTLGNGPSTFTTPTTVGDEIGVMVGGGQAVGIYKIWAQVTDSPEIPVIDCGNYQLYSHTTH